MRRSSLLVPLAVLLLVSGCVAIKFGREFPSPDRQLIVLQRQGAFILTPTLLLNRQIAGFCPRQPLPMFIEQRPEFKPRRGTDSVITLLEQPPQMPHGKSAPIREQGQLGGAQMLADQRELLGHRRMSVLVAIDRVPKQRQRPEVVHIGAQPRVNHERAVGGVIGLVYRQYLPEAWWFATFPGIAIFLVVFGFNLLGDGLRDVVDPRLRRSR